MSFAFTSVEKTFVVTVGQSDGSDVFLVDGGQNVDLALASGSAYLFDLSYNESYEFGLATNYDASGGTDYTIGLTYGAPYLFLESAPANSLYYYEKSDTDSNPNMGNIEQKQWIKQGLDISGTSTLFTDINNPFFVGKCSKVTPDGNTVVSMSDYLACIFDWSGNEWKLRDYFSFLRNYDDAGSNEEYVEGGSVAITDDGTTFAYSIVQYGTVYIYTGWDGTQWGNSHSVTGSFLGYQNIEFSSDNAKLIMGDSGTTYGRYTGIIKVYDLSENTTNDIFHYDFMMARFGWCVDMTSNGNTVVGSTYDDSRSYYGFFKVYDWNDSTSSWDIRGDLVAMPQINIENNYENLGRFCKISDNGNMVAVWTVGNFYLQIYYWDGSSWINTLFDNNGNSGLVINTSSVFNPSNSAVSARGACFYEDGAKVAIKGLSDSSYNIYFYAFNTSTNTWELDSTSPNFVLDDGMTPLGSSDETRTINISNDGNTLCIGNHEAYSNNGALQVYKYI